MESCLMTSDIDETVVDDKDDVNKLILKLKIKIEKEPHEINHYLHLKSLYSAYIQDSKAAVDILEQALTHFPTSILLLLELAAVHEFEIEDIKVAKMYYERVLALDPANEFALKGLDILNDKNIHP